MRCIIPPVSSESSPQGLFQVGHNKKTFKGGAHPDQILELPQLAQPDPAGTNMQSQSSRGRYRANQSVSVNVVNKHAAVPAAQEEEERKGGGQKRRQSFIVGHVL